MGVYEPYDKGSETATLIAKARARNRCMSRVEHKNGLAAPEDVSLDEGLRTVIGALVAGVELWGRDQHGALECITEGIALLQDIEDRLRERYVKIEVIKP